VRIELADGNVVLSDAPGATLPTLSLVACAYAVLLSAYVYLMIVPSLNHPPTSSQSQKRRRPAQERIDRM
jgi:hypothetical protein